jgi:hypothetical protein
MLKINLSEQADESKNPAESGAPVEAQTSGSEHTAPRDMPESPAIEERAPVSPALGEESSASKRKETTPTAKVPLSEHAGAAFPDIPPAPPVPEAPDPEPQRSGAGSRVRTAVLSVLLVAVAGYGVYSQKDRITGLMHRKPAPARTTEIQTAKPGAPAEQPPAAQEKTAPTPAISAMDYINGSAPALVWMTSMTVSAEGEYELSGLSFSQAAIQTFSSALKTLGTVTRETIPSGTSAPGATYTFGIAGKLAVIKPSEIPDTLSSEQLVALGRTLAETGKGAGITFTRTPGAHAVYEDADLPFEATGSLEKIQTLLSDVSTAGKLTVYRMTVRSASYGPPYDNVRVSFSLRAVSAI